MSASYRERPVFGWPIDWATLPQSKLEYDLREVAIGFGTHAFYGEQDAVIRGWRFVCWLDDGAAIQEFEDFFDGLNGRLIGFWLPTPEAAFRIVAGVDATRFKIEACGLATWWEDHPCAYLWLTKDGQDPQGAKITGVTANGDGTETVTVEESVSVDATWHARWLAYVRLADDIEQGEFRGEGRLKATVQVIELPAEYAEIETGSKPVFLYHFFTKAGEQVDWYWTSFAWDLEDIDGIDWLAKRITHGSLVRSTRGINQLTLESDREEPLSLLVPPVLAQALFVEVREASYDSLSAQTVIFSGRVMGASCEGRRLTLKCSTLMDTGTRCPTFLLSRRCNHRLYESNTCRVSQAAFQKACTVAAINGRLVTVTFPEAYGLAANWFANGWIETGTGHQLDRKTILTSTVESSQQVTLTLTHPLSWAALDDAALVVPGCDGTESQCATKFSNFINYGGHRFALRNLSLRAVEVPAISGGKK
ncbi:MAG: phage BR0599 family protein [Verrucomicrobiales bacterium]|nr:phage BR0599 family protein [Verrucomicrobiales bacterium]